MYFAENISKNVAKHGHTENAGLENGGPKNIKGWKMQDRKMQDQRATDKRCADNKTSLTTVHLFAVVDMTLQVQSTAFRLHSLIQVALMGIYKASTFRNFLILFAFHLVPITTHNALIVRIGTNTTN